MLIADKNYYLNADKSEIVPGDSPEAAFLLVAEGGAIDEAEAEKYGLKLKEQPEAEPESGVTINRTSTKRSPGASEDK
jgi:hypothetical protein